MSLDRFKRDIGFQPRPVHRRGRLPSPAASRAHAADLLDIARHARLRPRNRLLRKMVGFLALQLGRHKPLPLSAAAESGTAPEREESADSFAQ